MTLADRPLQVCHYYARAFELRSGVTGALAAWAAAQAAAGDEVTILGAPSPGTGTERYPDGVEALAIPHLGRGRGTWVPRNLRDHLRDRDVLVLHEGWTPSTAIAAEAARRAEVPYVVVPHGVYEPQWVELLRAASARSLAERRVLSGAAAVHLFFASEAGPIRSLAPRARLLIAPTGFQLADRIWSDIGSNRLVWIGRYSIQHKGLDLLLGALALLPGDERPELVMRGVDERGERQRVEDLVARLKLQRSVHVGGPVYGEEKTELLLSCTGYVQPSRWECHSVGLLEALAHGVPTLVTASMHVAGELQNRGGAIVVSPEPAAIARGLSSLAAGAPSVGQAGRRYVADCLDWTGIMASYRLQIRSVLDGEPFSTTGDAKGAPHDAHR